MLVDQYKPVQTRTNLTNIWSEPMDNIWSELVVEAACVLRDRHSVIYFQANLFRQIADLSTNSSCFPNKDQRMTFDSRDRIAIVKNRSHLPPSLFQSPVCHLLLEDESLDLILP